MHGLFLLASGTQPIKPDTTVPVIINTTIATISTTHEGLRLKPYTCTAGKLTIGYGRNLDDLGISKGEAEILLERDLIRVMAEVEQVVPNFNELNPTRQGVMVDMIFNLGVNRFKGFKNMLSAVENHDYRKAAAEMLDSKWAVQVGGRASNLAHKMENGI